MKWTVFITGSIITFVAMSIYNTINYWQVEHIAKTMGAITKYALVTSVFQVGASIILFLGIQKIYAGIGNSIWGAMASVALCSGLSKILPIYIISLKIPTKGELLGLILLFVSVFVSAFWK